MRHIGKFIPVIVVLGTLLTAVPARAGSAVLWTPPLRGNLLTGSAAGCMVFWTDKAASSADASVVVDLIRGDTGAVIATASASGPFSPGTQMTAAYDSSTPDVVICRITASGVSKSKVRAVLEAFNAVTGVPAAAVALSR